MANKPHSLALAKKLLRPHKRCKEYGASVSSITTADGKSQAIHTSESQMVYKWKCHSSPRFTNLSSRKVFQPLLEMSSVHARAEASDGKGIQGTTGPYAATSSHPSTHHFIERMVHCCRISMWTLMLNSKGTFLVRIQWNTSLCKVYCLCWQKS